MTPDSFALFVVDSTASSDRAVDLDSWIERYERDDDVSFPATEIHPTSMRAGPPPELSVRPGSKRDRASEDVANAILLHEWLRDVLHDRRTQRDNRLWTWLAHGPFRDYCRRRYPLAPSVSLEAKKNSVRSHWFLQGEGRGAVGRHAIARLWWGVEATIRPEAVDQAFAARRGENDPYRYARILLGYQNAYLQIRDRTFGSSRLILLSALEALRQLGASGGSIDEAAARLGREINLVSRYRNLDGLRAAELVPLFLKLTSASVAEARVG